MAAAPQFKVFTPDGEYIGCCKDAEDAGALACFRGIGSTIRTGHSKRDTVYTVNAESADSYDAIAESVFSAIETRRAALKLARGE